MIDRLQCSYLKFSTSDLNHPFEVPLTKARGLAHFSDGPQSHKTDIRMMSYCHNEFIIVCSIFYDSTVRSCRTEPIFCRDSDNSDRSRKPLNLYVILHSILVYRGQREPVCYTA